MDASVTEYNLTRLLPGSKYMVQLQAKRGGRYMSATSTEFSTGTAASCYRPVMFDHVFFINEMSLLCLHQEMISTTSYSFSFPSGTLRFPFPSDCSQELLNGIRTSGKVEIFPQGKLGTPLMVYCDMETDGGGWMVW